MKTTQALLLAAVAAPGWLAAATVTLPHTFSNGTVADADQVNANFSAVKAAVDDNANAINALSGTFSTTTVCSADFYTGNNGTNFYRDWSASDCTNGLPTSSCVGFLSQAVHSGSDQDWAVAVPGETIGAFTFPTGGMYWWTGNPTDALIIIQAVYLCP
jgi:hypothetical protein